MMMMMTIMVKNTIYPEKKRQIASDYHVKLFETYLTVCAIICTQMHNNKWKQELNNNNKKRTYTNQNITQKSTNHTYHHH